MAHGDSRSGRADLRCGCADHRSGRTDPHSDVRQYARPSGPPYEREKYLAALSALVISLARIEPAFGIAAVVRLVDRLIYCIQPKLYWP